MEQLFRDQIKAAIEAGRQAERIEMALKNRIEKAPGGAGRTNYFRAGYDVGGFSGLTKTQLNARRSAVSFPGGGSFLSELFDFSEKKAPVGLEQGYGNVVVRSPAAVLNAVTDANELGSILQHVSASVQTYEELDGGRSYQMSRHVTSRDYLRKQAASILDAKSGNLGNLAENDFGGKNVLTLDIETAGLSSKSGIWQIAYQAGEGDVQEINFKNSMMHLGVQDSADGVRAFAANMNNQKPFAAGMQEILEQIANSDMIVGQNVSFDLEHIFANAEKLRGVTPELDSALNSAMRKVYKADGAAMYDTLGALRFFRGDIMPVGDMTPLSQQNIVHSTTFLEDALGAGYLDKDDVRMLSGGLHDARIDIRVSRAIALLTRDIARGNDNLLRGANVDDVVRVIEEAVPGLNGQEILRTVRETSAITPNTELSRFGKRTSQQVLVEGTRGAAVSADTALPSLKAIYGVVGVYDPDAVVDGAVGLTNEAMGALDNRMGMINPAFARTFELADSDGNMVRTPVHKLGPGMSAVAETVQERLRGAGVAFANLSEHERLVGTLINRTSGLQGVRGEVARSMASEMGVTYVKPQIGNLSGRSSQIIMDPKAFEYVTGGSDLFDNEGPFRKLHVSTAKGEQRLVTFSARVFDEDQTKRGKQVTHVVDRFRELFRDLGDDQAKELAGRLGVSEDRAASILDSLMDGSDSLDEAVEGFVGSLNNESKTKYGVQLAQVSSSEGAAAIDDLAQGRDFSKGHNPFSVLVDPEELATERVAATSMPFLDGMDEEELVSQTRRALGTARAAEAGLTGGEVTPLRKTSMALSVRGMDDAAEKGHRIAAFFEDAANKRMVTRGSLLTLGALGVAAMIKDSDEENMAEETFSTMGYQSDGDYISYKVGMGESAAPDFSTNPTSRMMNDPLETAGMVQSLHDNKTGKHNMNTASKYSYLFGRG